MFDPVRIADDACVEGHLDADPVHQLLLTLGQRSTTGRLTVADAAGDNHMFFMNGRPVGVLLAERVHPLGQLLLELGRCDAAMFLKAQHLIAEGGRLPGQVFKELGVLDDHTLKDALAVQARRKAEHFCRLSSRPFTFCKGLTYLNGFTSTPLDSHGVVFLAVRQQTDEELREAVLESARHEQVRLVDPGLAVVDPERLPANLGLPALPAAYGFGPPEERFLARLLVGWESVADLAETGTLPRDEMAVLLRYLDFIGRLQRRPMEPPPTVLGEPTFEPREPQSLDDMAIVELGEPGLPPAVVPAIVPTLLPDGPTPLVAPPPWSSSPPPPSVARPAVERASAPPPPDREAAGLRPRPPSAKIAPPAPLDGSDAVTAPRRLARRPATPSLTGEVFSSTLPAPVGAANPALSEPTPLTLPPEPPPEEDVAAPVVRKKKVKRSEPLPSEVSAVMVSETRREKTMIAALPSIVIEDD
ncbi:MAG: hypothetical protein FJ137_06130 [Deltaproteobacteria bacterium]|nr:hypothetical protein [Deltaproteobacteria bacterium]